MIEVVTCAKDLTGLFQKISLVECFLFHAVSTLFVSMGAVKDENLTMLPETDELFKIGAEVGDQFWQLYWRVGEKNATF